ncbi:hypothetical protein [Legionella sp. 227]|uniref:hypothetical protein n=1 Tax=Legionella sp. 227 TaxID=3367288 RepID=UPI00370D7EF5
MKTEQLRAIYTKPEEISEEQMLLEQIKELAELEFNENFNKFIKSKEIDIQLFISPAGFDASKYSKNYLDFLNDLILALSLEEKDIKTDIIRQKRALNEDYSTRRGSRDKYQPINDVGGNTTLPKNVIIRLHAFIKKLEPLRNQQLILQAQSLVKLTNEEITAKQHDLTRMQGDYLKLLSSSNTSPQSFVEFERNFDLLLNEKIFSTLKQQLVKRKLDMSGIMEKGNATSVEEAIREEQSKLDVLIANFESIMEQAAVLKNLTALCKKIKNIEGIVIQADNLLVPSDAQKLQELIQLLEKKEQEIQSIKQEIEIGGASKEHQQTVQNITNIEKCIKQKREQATLLLEQVSTTSSKSQQKEEQSDTVSTPKEITPVVVERVEEIQQPTTPPIEKTEPSIRQEKEQDVSLIPLNGQQKEDPSDHTSLTSNGEQPPKQSDQFSEKAIADKKIRLQEAISLINMYKGTLEYEKVHSVKFFHKSRNQAKIDYCSSLEKKLGKQMETLNSTSNVLDIINEAHNSVTQGSIEEITKGGSYFGTSRMLSVQRLLGVKEAWEKKGHSKFLGFSTTSDFHGLKSSGIVGASVQKIVNNFYNEIEDSDSAYQALKKQVFPEEPVIKLSNN